MVMVASAIGVLLSLHRAMTVKRQPSRCPGALISAPSARLSGSSGAYAGLATNEASLLDCIVLGDSIAFGLGQARPDCEVVAVSGITSERYVQSFLTARRARTVVISLGVNDGAGVATADNLRRLSGPGLPHLSQSEGVEWAEQSERHAGEQRCPLTAGAGAGTGGGGAGILAGADEPRVAAGCQCVEGDGRQMHHRGIVPGVGQRL